ncbi:hypothetical protein EGI24_06400 [Lacihabitans sp. CS3-21]|nr:hypothetical protein [Lacihabitans sp. CS3-21]
MIQVYQKSDVFYKNFVHSLILLVKNLCFEKFFKKKGVFFIINFLFEKKGIILHLNSTEESPYQ